MMSIAHVFFASLSLAAGSEEFDRTAAEGAASIVVNRVKEELQSKPFYVDELTDAMLSDPAKSSKRSDAEKVCREIYLKEASLRLQSEAEKIFARLAGTKGADKVFSEKFRNEAVKLDAAEEKKITAGSFPKAFKDARKKACDEQAEKIALKIRPSMAEADKGDDSEMRKSLTKRIAESQGKAVFEENMGYISQKIVNPIIEDAKREKRRQSEYVRRVRSDAMAPSALSRDIADKLVSNVNGRKADAKNAAMAWDVFPSVTNITLRNTVKRRINEGFSSAISETTFVVRKEDVVKIITTGGDEHRTASGSEKAVAKTMSEKLFAAAEKDYVNEAEVGERSELQSYLQNLHNDRDVVKVLDRRIKDTVVPIWKSVRSELVKKEFEKTWPSLAESTWYPDAMTADDICSRSDFVRSVRNWRKLPALSELHKGKKVFAETDKMADEKIREAFEIARTALMAQTGIVEGEMPAVLAEAVEKKESFWTRTPKLGDIVTMLTAATEKRWGEIREKTLWKVEGSAPKNASEQHVELFPSVKRKIELVARTIFEEMMKDPEDRKEKPEEPNPVIEEPENKPEEELCTISFKQEGSSITISAKKGGRTIIERKAKLTASDFENAVKEVGRVVGREVLKLK